MRFFAAAFLLLLPMATTAQEPPDTLWLADGRRVLGQMHLRVDAETGATLIAASNGEAFAPSFVSSFTMGDRRFRTHPAPRASARPVSVVERASQGVIDLYAPLPVRQEEATHFEAPDGRLWALTAAHLAPHVAGDVESRALVRQARTARVTSSGLIALGGVGVVVGALDGVRRLNSSNRVVDRSIVPALMVGLVGSVGLVVGIRTRDRHGRLLRQAVLTYDP